MRKQLAYKDHKRPSYMPPRPPHTVRHNLLRDPEMVSYLTAASHQSLSFMGTQVQSSHERLLEENQIESGSHAYEEFNYVEMKAACNHQEVFNRQTWHACLVVVNPTRIRQARELLGYHKRKTNKISNPEISHVGLIKTYNSSTGSTSGKEGHIR